FDLHAGGLPQQLLWPNNIDFAPFDMAPAPGGAVWILDRVNRRYWALGRQFQVIDVNQDPITVAGQETDAFQPSGGGQPRPRGAPVFPGGIALQLSSPLDAHDPIAIEALPDGTVLILDRNPVPSFSEIQRYEFGKLRGKVSTEIMRSLVEKESRDGFALIGHDFAFLPEHESTDGAVFDRLYVVAEDGNQAFAFKLTQLDGALRLEPLDDYLPMRLFGGKGLVAGGKVPYYDSSDRWIPLVRQRRPRYALEATLHTPLPDAGETSSPPGSKPSILLDGRDPDCVWHRLMLDACIPPGTHVTVWSRAGNDKHALAHADWQAEPALHARGDGPEQPYVPETAGYRTWELLFQEAQGQYLQLKLQVTGTGRSTPRLRSLRAYYPRFS